MNPWTRPHSQKLTWIAIYLPVQLPKVKDYSRFEFQGWVYTVPQSLLLTLTPYLQAAPRIPFPRWVGCANRGQPHHVLPLYATPAMPLAVHRPSRAHTTSCAIKRPSMVQRHSAFTSGAAMLQPEVIRWKSIVRRSIRLRVSQYVILKNESCRADRCSAITEYISRKSQFSSSNPENLSPILGDSIVNPGHMEAHYNDSTFEISDPGFIRPSWLRGNSEATKDNAINTPSFGTTKVAGITPLHTGFGMSSPSLEPGDSGYMRTCNTRSTFETAGLMSDSTLDWDQGIWKLNEDELCWSMRQ